MAVTTNYNWTTPDDTNLVKDGALAIRTLGSSIDTTTKNLNPSTTLGDIEYRSSTANTNTRLGIGTTGQVLTVAGGVPAWGTPSAGGMTLISTTTLSGASVTLSSIPQTYKSLYIVTQGYTANTSNNTYRILPNNVNNLTSAIYTRGFPTGNTTHETSLGPLYPNYFQSTLRTDANNISTVEIKNYTSTTSYKTFSTEGGIIGTDSNFYTFQGAGVFASNTAITSLVLDYGGTGITFAGGTVLFYGVN